MSSPVPTRSVIEAHEATILTAAVEVKVLTIRGRQVTMAVFRQLRREPVIDLDSGEVRIVGVPWGRVQYLPPPCENRDPEQHLHIVWQKGDELRRACVDPLQAGRTDCDPNDRWTLFNDWWEYRQAVASRGAAKSLAFATSAAEDPADVQFQPAGGRDNYHGAPGTFTLKSLGWTWEFKGGMYPDQHDPAPVHYKHALADLVRARDHGLEWRGYEGDKYVTRPVPPEVALPQQVAKLRGLIAQFAGGVPTAGAALAAYQECEAEADRLLAEIKANEARYGRLYEQLTSLPQLFIAV